MTAQILRWRFRPALTPAGGRSLEVASNIAWGPITPGASSFRRIEKEFGWKRAQTSLVSTIDMATLASTFVFAGYLQNRLGPRVISTIGGVFSPLGFLSASFTQSLPVLYLTRGLMVGFSLGFGYLPPITVGAKWFPHRRGL